MHVTIRNYLILLFYPIFRTFKKQHCLFDFKYVTLRYKTIKQL